MSQPLIWAALEFQTCISKLIQDSFQRLGIAFELNINQKYQATISTKQKKEDDVSCQEGISTSNKSLV